MDIPKQAVILCGGLGERLRPLTDLVPKPMVLVNGAPFLWYLLEQLKDNGIKEVILLTGYRGEQICEYFKDGNQLGLSIRYSHGPVEWETGRRLFEAKELLDEHFLLLYSDNFLPFNLKKIVKFYNEQKKLLSFIVQPKEKGNIRMGEAGVVQVYDKTRSAAGLGFVELGYMIVNKKVFEFYSDKDVSFSDIINKLVSVGQVAGFTVLDTYYSISDVQRLRMMEKYLQPKKILLIDRDGVINKKAPRGEYIGSWEDFSFIQENIEGMKKLSQAGFSFIVISNQAGIARGMVTAEAVEFIHQRMKEALNGEGISILDIYLCPHHWDEKCFCRKPEPGLFFEAARKWSFRLDKAYFIGDDPRDCQAAYRAGCGCVYTGQNDDLKDLGFEEKPEFVVKNLNEAVPFLEKI
ncbi:MAG: HAD-IIIA family hydrolase [Candidatus Omnitrophica bacterium]|nr:HAD-IIIA family hydrolase [Candidatus Omnitrophota bacterium]